MTITHYTTATLERDLKEYEERFGMASDEFFAIYCEDDVPTEIPGPEGFRWADTFSELCRLRAG